MKPSSNQRTAGLTLIELLIVISLVGVILVKGVLVLRTTSTMVSTETSRMMVQDQAQVVLDRIALAVMSSDRETLAPILNPGFSSDINYQLSLGVENGVVVWGAPERISLAGSANEQVMWSQSPGEADEFTSIWSKAVEPLLEGEVLNGLDDNGNGLVDELGLSFIVEGNQVTVRLTLGRVAADQSTTLRTVETVVSVRNNPLAP